jgi:hypothetical protein
MLFKQICKAIYGLNNNALWEYELISYSLSSHGAIIDIKVLYPISDSLSNQFLPRGSGPFRGNRWDKQQQQQRPSPCWTNTHTSVVFCLFMLFHCLMGPHLYCIQVVISVCLSPSAGFRLLQTGRHGHGVWFCLSCSRSFACCIGHSYWSAG